MGKNYSHFTPQERCEIAVLQGQACSIRQIAAALDRSPSTISREVKRNASSRAYEPINAENKAKARRWTGCKLERDPQLRQLVLHGLAHHLSPEQIAGRLKLEHRKTLISHETIYRFIHGQIARHKDGSWRFYLPEAKSKRGRRKASPAGSVNNIKNRVSIDKRPAYIQARKQPGHLEADLILFSNKKSNILVLQERSSRFIRLFRQKDRTAKRVHANLYRCLKTLPREMRRTLTQDNGVEFANHHELNHSLHLKTYFCHPHCPSEKGGIENINRRLRRFLPLKTDFAKLTTKRLKSIENHLNNTPRKCLGYKTPNEVFSKQLLHFKCESTFPPSRTTVRGKS